jgi:hypothetical protein
MNDRNEERGIGFQPVFSLTVRKAGSLSYENPFAIHLDPGKR